MTATNLMTVEELERTPLEGRWELIEGELVEIAPSGDRSSSVAATIVYLISAHVRPEGLGRVYGADGGFVLFPDRQTVRVPDVAFVRADRMPADDERDRFPRLAPDLAVEVLSPDDRAGEVMQKLAMYLEAGVRLVWIVDPRARTVLVVRPDAPTLTLGEGDTLSGGDVLPWFSVPVAELFDW